MAEEASAEEATAEGAVAAEATAAAGATAAAAVVTAAAAALAAAAWHARLSLSERLPALGPPRGLGPFLAGGKPSRTLSAAASFCRLLTSDCSVRGFTSRGGGSKAESHII